MAPNPNMTPAAPESARVSAIENEIPAYRAITPAAVLSLICGLLGLLSFTSWFFLGFAALAVALGVYADRKIRRDPEIWTGRGLAQAGTALGMAFGLAAVTTTLVQDFLQTRAATQFSRKYVEILKKGKMEEAVWYLVAPAGRETKSPAEILKEFKSRATDPRMMEMETAGLMGFKKYIDETPGVDVHFEKLETHGLDGLNVFASALLEVHGPPAKGQPSQERHAMLLLKGITTRGKYQWWVEDTKFPYTPSSYVPAAKPVDDGHGHAH